MGAVEVTGRTIRAPVTEDYTEALASSTGPRSIHPGLLTKLLTDPAALVSTKAVRTG
jgi:hypothetical protein